jgi:hypothetical protein
MCAVHSDDLTGGDNRRRYRGDSGRGLHNHSVRARHIFLPIVGQRNGYDLGGAGENTRPKHALHGARVKKSGASRRTRPKSARQILRGDNVLPCTTILADKSVCA